jgi:hemerythrin-like domain-containing protein
MLPIGPLMIEHRLIERMIGLMKKQITRFERKKEVNPEVIETAVDFIARLFTHFQKPFRTPLTSCHLVVS